MTAAIIENFSTQWEMSVIGGRAGGGARPGTWGGASLVVSSDISTNSKSRIFLTTLGGRDAAGLYGPWAPMGSGTIGGGRVLLLAVAAAAASRLSPEDSADPGLKVGVSFRGSAVR